MHCFAEHKHTITKHLMKAKENSNSRRSESVCDIQSVLVEGLSEMVRKEMVQTPGGNRAWEQHLSQTHRHGDGIKTVGNLPMAALSSCEELQCNLPETPVGCIAASPTSSHGKRPNFPRPRKRARLLVDLSNLGSAERPQSGLLAQLEVEDVDNDL